jgi:hypothetical protein
LVDKWGRSERLGEEKIIWTLPEFELQPVQAVASELPDCYIRTRLTAPSQKTDDSLHT